MEKKVYNCPKCGKEMKTGKASVHGTVLGFFLVGSSHQNLYFYDNDRKKRNDKSMIIYSNSEKSAQRCTDCEFVLITG